MDGFVADVDDKGLRAEQRVVPRAVDEFALREAQVRGQEDGAADVGEVCG